MRLSFRVLRGPLIIVLLIYGLYAIPAARGVIIYTLGPLVRIARIPFNGAMSAAATLKAIPRLAKENGQLSVRVHEFEALGITNQELKHENELLRKELSLTTTQDANSKIVAQVISRSSSVSIQSITVDKGSSEGFAVGMPVMAQGYLIGRVEEVLSHSSKVKLITSADSLLPVVLQNSRSVGLLKGGAEGLLVDEIPRDVAIVQGEAIVTSNVGDVIKSGIPIGTVSLALSGKSDVFQSARVTSPIDLSRLEVVFGVK